MQVQRAQKLFQSLVTKRVPKRNAHCGTSSTTTYNDLPIPHGSWQTHYDAQQKKYNAHLAIGIGSTIVSLVAAKAGGFLELHYNPPDCPAESNDYSS